MSISQEPRDIELLDQMRGSLLAARPPALDPQQSREAFQQHKLLASAIHRASRLDARSSDSETDAWVNYFTAHFPAPRNDATDARLLFAEWRTSLLKDDAPGPRTPITHGQPHAHWQRDRAGRLCINLEDMRADFERSVDHLLAHLRATPARQAVAVRRWRQTSWTVQPFTFSSADSVPVSGATVAASATVARHRR
jgi:hypothetical protein